MRKPQILALAEPIGDPRSPRRFNHKEERRLH
jgi:hypothetical protein